METRSQKSDAKKSEENDNNTEIEIVTLQRKRDKALSFLTRFEEFLNCIGDDETAEQQLIIRIDKLNEKWKEVESLQSQIDDVTEVSDDESEEHEEKYLNLLARAQTIKKSFDKIISVKTDNQLSTTRQDNNDLRLPPIKPPIFNGNIESWLPFYDLFSSVIDRNSSLTNTQKLYYLKSGVSGEAKNLIDSLELIDANYAVAIDLLKNRFHNKNLIIQRHIGSLFNLPKVEKESASQLRLLLDTALKHISTLESLREPTKHWDTILIYMISIKLDHKTSKEWQLTVKPDKIPTLEELKSFLHQKCQMLEAIPSSASSDKSTTQIKSSFNHKNKHQNNSTSQNCFHTVPSQQNSSELCKHSSNNQASNKFSSNNQASNRFSSNSQTNSTHSSRYNTFNNSSNKQSHNKTRNNQPYNHSNNNQYSNSQHEAYNSRPSSSNHTYNNQVQTSNYQIQRCDLCQLNHSLCHCPQLLKLTPSQRAEQLRILNKCLNCIRSGHSVDQCRSPTNCKRCLARHNTLICQQTQNSNNNESIAMHASSPPVSLCAILSTAVVYVKDKVGNFKRCRALLDCGSESSYISQALAQSLGLKRIGTNVLIRGINGSVSSCSSQVLTTLRSANEAFSVEQPLYVLPNTTDKIPTSKINFDPKNIPVNIVLADPSFYTPAPIDLILGTDIFWDILDNQTISLHNNDIQLRLTKFGWIVTKSNFNSHSSVPTTTMCHLSISENFQLEKFWKIEEFKDNHQFSGEDKICEEHFKRSTSIHSSGRFIVKLPLRKEPEVLGDSYNTAMHRFNLVERRFKKNPVLHQEYSKFMNEYISLGHMKPVCAVDVKGVSYFIPHHPVFKESTTTRLRVVFDASCKSSSGKSLNDIAIAGPNVQSSLISILIRFRTYPVVVTADVEKMYRQVLLHPSQTSLQTILWRENETQQIAHYQLQTVTYGVSSAAYLATRSLKEIGEDKSLLTETRSSIQEDFYVDDWISGGFTPMQTRQKLDSVRSALSKRGFHLRKYCSNHPELLKHLPSDDISQELLQFDGQDISVKTLGLVWNPIFDSFKFSVSLKENNPVTKRTVLSVISQIYDPLGLVGPIITKAKCFMQHLWNEDISWDQALPDHLCEQWTTYKTSLQELKCLKIQRPLITPSKIPKLLQIHGFADSSEKAYGACIYLHAIYEDNTETSNLITSKSRVAPLKQVSLPRLELCAALLLAELLDATIIALNLEIKKTYLWTDSQIVLTWLASPSTHWTTFVANRVAKIQNLTDNYTWQHVSSVQNPADIISRGALPGDLATSSLWWNGPHWILSHPSTWPSSTCKQDPVTEIPEAKKKKIITCISLTNTIIDFNRFSSFKRLKRTIALVLRFIHNIKPYNRDKMMSGPISLVELENSTTLIVKLVQREIYYSEISRLISNGHISRKSKILPLAPYLDKDELLHVGGRLKHSNLTPDQRNQIILPDHHVTKLIIRDEHYKLLHLGPQGLLNAIRQRYWPIGGRSLIRKVLNKCIVCFRIKPRCSSQIMGELPKERVTPAKPFNFTAIDYCGPFYIKISKRRGVQPTKAYVALFTCFVTKAVHLELAEDMSTVSFLSALQRFISRRGKPSYIYSDNGSNFVGADRELRELRDLFHTENFKLDLNQSTTEQGIRWHFQPPKSPHMGGLHESGIRSIKYHLKRTIGKQKLNYFQFITILTQIESIVNSRPITPLSSDPSDLLPLTPSHFLVGDSLTALPVPNLRSLKVNLLDHWHLTQQLAQHFWTRWSKEYLNELQQRSKWRTEQNNITIGTLALIQEENVPTMSWKLGRVIEVHKGLDGKVRVVTLKTSCGTYKRSIVKICPLPILDNTYLPSHYSKFLEVGTQDSSDVQPSSRQSEVRTQDSPDVHPSSRKNI